MFSNHLRKIISSKLRPIVFFTVLFIALMILDFIRIRYTVPVAMGDIVMFPLSLLIIIYFLKNVLLKRKHEPFQYPIDDSKLRLMLNLLFSLILLVPLGLYLSWMGIQEPFAYFSGVKGAIHGYTSVAVGTLVAGLGFIFVYETIQRLIRNIKT